MINYNANGGSDAPESQVKTYNIVLTLSTTEPTRTGYTFQGWGTSATATSVSYLPGDNYSENAGATLYALWKPNQYTIDYNTNGGSGAPDSQLKTHDVALTLSTIEPTRTGYTFQGWATGASATTAEYLPGATYEANAAATLYAFWQPKNYTVAFDANGGKVSPESASVTYNGVYGDLPTPSRSRYLFDGWYTASTGGNEVTAATKVTTASNHTLYAHWREISKLELPASLTRIEDEAFMGCASMSVVIPAQCEYIGSKAFANSDALLYVLFPQNDMVIKADAFTNCPNLTFVCYEDTSAQIFAQGKNIPYILYQSD